MLDDSLVWKTRLKLDLKSPRVLIKLGLLITGLLFVAIGCYFYYSAPVVAQTIQTCPSVEPTSGENISDLSMLTVDINGAVNHPGVYQMPIGSSRKDLVVMAGGFSQQVSKAYVAKTLNLAAELKDQEKIYLPFANEEVQPQCDLSSNDTGLISINRANQKELESLPGIGAVAAEKIISARPFVTLTELVSRQILSEKIYDQLKTQLSL